MKKTASQEYSKKLVLLDAHAILHRAYHALPDFASSKGEPTGGLYGLSTMVMKIVEDFNPDYIIACYDLPQATYRHEAYKEYKAGRKKADPELVSQINRSRDVFGALSIPIYEKAGYEADDILGTICSLTKPEKDLGVVIASGDMDTMQLIEGERVQVYTLRKGIRDTVIYNEKAVEERFGFGPELLPDYKGLRGDPSDNIIGIKGIGEKTATTLICTFGTIEAMYKALKKSSTPFTKVGITPRIIELLKNNEEEALFSKMLATIKRDVPIEFALPQKSWKESVDIKAFEKLFAELEFRSLIPRVKQILTGEVAPASSIKAKSGKKAGSSVEGTVGVEGDLFSSHIPDSVSKELLRETTVGLWLLNSNLTDPTYEDVLHFADTDSFDTAREVILAEIKKRGLTNVFENIELPLIPIVDRMRDVGVKIDVPYFKKLGVEYHKELDALEKKIWKEAGQEFNINSPRQLGDIVFDKLAVAVKGTRMKKTEGGARSTRESELEKIKDAHPIIPLILEYRQFQKLLSTYIDTLPTLVGPDGRLHATFVQTGSTTGRFSSQNPNLQNIPIKSELGRRIRGGFVAEKGFSLVACDYSQIELRLAAILSGDPGLLEIFKSGRDVHTEVAALVFKVPVEKVDKEMRRKAKVINFGILYGMGVNALRANLGGTRDEAQLFYNEYFNTFTTLASYLNQTKADAARKGYTETLFGRRRYFEGITSRMPHIKAAAERMAINAPIQGTQADMIKLSMSKINEWIVKEKRQDDVRLLMQVHDELIYEVREREATATAERIVETMQSVLPADQAKGVPILVHSSTGQNWGDMTDA